MSITVHGDRMDFFGDRAESQVLPLLWIVGRTQCRFLLDEPGAILVDRKPILMSAFRSIFFAKRNTRNQFHPEPREVDQPILARAHPICTTYPRVRT